MKPPQKAKAHFDFINRDEPNQAQKAQQKPTAVSTRTVTPSLMQFFSGQFVFCSSKTIDVWNQFYLPKITNVTSLSSVSLLTLFQTETLH